MDSTVNMFKRLALTLLLLLASTAALATQAQSFTIIGQDNLQFSKTHITVAPGTKVTVKLVNKSHLPASAMAHNWVLLKADTDVDAFAAAARNARGNDYIPAAQKDEIIAHTKMIGGGHSDSVTFTAPDKPGDYEYICTFPGHYKAGMTGVITVAPPS
jgi:azurin